MNIEECRNYKYFFHPYIDGDCIFAFNKRFARKVGVTQAFLFSLFVDAFNHSMSIHAGARERDSKIYAKVSLSYISKQVAPFIDPNVKLGIDGTIWCSIMDLRDMGVIDITEDYVYNDTILHIAINAERVNELCGKSENSNYDRFILG